MQVCRWCSSDKERCKCPEFKDHQIQSGEWVQPVRKGYKMVCCDCGLVHVLDFRIKSRHIQFRAKREDE